MFETNPKDLKVLLENIDDGKLQLPDFQRDWVWNDEGVRSLIASIASGFPIGAILTLSIGGDVRFKPRTLAHAPNHGIEPEELLLDGQQRMTSCFQVLKSQQPVTTKNAKGRPLALYYFIDMQRALKGHSRMEQSIISVPADLKLKTNFDRDIVRDLSTSELQFNQHMFPLNRSFDELEWFMGYQNIHGAQGFERLQQFKAKVLSTIQNYKVPVIRLNKENTREAVCTVFEKVNVGGEKLDAFELLTAIFAADNFDLRADMRGHDGEEGRLSRMRGQSKESVLRDLSERDVLQVATLLQTYDARMAYKKTGKTDFPAVSIKAEALLELKTEIYQEKADAIETGFIKARQFLNRLHITRARDIPYLPASKTLATIYALWDGPELNAAANARLERWFWCISLGESYGSSTDTRVVRDVMELLPWLMGGDKLPRSIEETSIRIDRLDRLKSRNAAGYKALNAALVAQGCLDFRTGKPAHQMDRDDDPIDIHHIFPKDWAKKAGIPAEIYDTIINKTPLFGQTNKKIGSKAPSKYLGKLDAELSKYNDGHDVNLEQVLKTHLIDPVSLRTDNFEEFYALRKEALARLIEEKTGITVVRSDAEQETNELDAIPDEDDY